MIARLPGARKALARLIALMSLVWIAACDPVGPAATSSTLPTQPGEPVQVALLVPSSGSSSDAFLSQNLENAARLAMADLNNVQVDLRVYDTAGNPAQAAIAATAAADDGAQIILGPLYAEAANAAAVAVADRGINVLAFSNNPAIAGGNLFILGSTFENTASRLVRYAGGQGTNSYMILHGDDLQGNAGRDAIAAAVRNGGGTIAGIESYPLSQQGIFSSGARIGSAVTAANPDAIFLTASVNSDLPIIATALPENGVDPAAIRYVGLTRWNAAPQAMALPGLQGGLFALPDQGLTAGFESRYRAAHGSEPHPLAGLAYDGMAAVGALVSGGGSNALSRTALTQGSGFQGTSGAFRLLSDGTNERSLAVAEIRNNQVVILDPAPRSFGGAGF